MCKPIRPFSEVNTDADEPTFVQRSALTSRSSRVIPICVSRSVSRKPRWESGENEAVGWFSSSLRRTDDDHTGVDAESDYYLSSTETKYT